MVIFSKVIDQLISVTLLKINSIIDQGICLDFKRNCLLNNLGTVVSVSLQTFCSTRRKEVCRIFCVRFHPLGVTVNESWKVNTNKLIRNIDLRNFLYLLTAILFHSSFVRKYVFYRKKFQYTYNFYATELYVDTCRDVFRTQSNIYGGASLQKLQESFIVDIRLGSKCASGIGFTVEKVYRMSIFIWYGQSPFQKLVIAFLFLELIKNMLV